MQLFNIFDDYEKKYQSWLRDKTTQWGESYKGSWLDKKTGLLQEKLWGKAPTRYTWITYYSNARNSRLVW